MEAWYIYYLIAFTGLAYLGISAFLAGDDTAEADADVDLDVDADFEADLSDALDGLDGADGDFDAGDVDMEADFDAEADGDGDADADGEEGGSHGGLAAWFSARVISGLLVGFGLTAGTLLLTGLPHWAAALAGIVVGWGFGYVVRLITIHVMGSVGNSLLRTEELLYEPGVVTATILPGRVGEVEVLGVVRSARAESEDKEIRVGEEIRVIQLGDELIVRPESEIIAAATEQKEKPDNSHTHGEPASETRRHAAPSTNHLDRGE